MYLLDVSGHGVSAAMLTMFCKNSIISGERLIRRYRGLKPHKNLEHFYNLFNSASFPPETHMVMFFAAYNTETKVLKYSSGGLNCYPILRKNNGEIYELSDNNGFPISKLGDLYTPEYTSSTIKLNDQDLVFFYTDGLIDYQKNQVIDYDELINLIKENGNARVIDQILEEKINNNKNHLNDDITYFIMEV
jgi:sigma-B regulation protein RsbU (phosphoserine phosphatase)